MRIINNFSDKTITNKVLAFGNFDGVHLGHDMIISEVQKISIEKKLSSAILTFDPHPSVVLKNKKDFLLMDLEQKIECIKRYDIDYLYVIKFDYEFSLLSAENFIKKILIDSCKIKHLVVGSKCFFGHQCSGNIALLESYSNMYGYEITVLNDLISNNRRYSSSLIREFLKEGKIDLANKILGRPHQINNKVSSGVGRGVKLGIPTINIDISHVLCPRFGVYYARVKIENISDWYYGIVNIGLRPTFNDLKFPKLEMHIFNFSDNLYGCKVQIQLLKFMRPEKRFQNVEMLKKQIQLDINEAKKLSIKL